MYVCIYNYIYLYIHIYILDCNTRIWSFGLEHYVKLGMMTVWIMIMYFILYSMCSGSYTV